MSQPEKQRAPRNRTLTLSQQERAVLSKRLLRLPLPASVRELTDQAVIHARADAGQPFMGMKSTRPGGIVRRADAAVAKNYLADAGIADAQPDAHVLGAGAVRGLRWAGWALIPGVAPVSGID